MRRVRFNKGSVIGPCFLLLFVGVAAQNLWVSFFGESLSSCVAKLYFLSISLSLFFVSNVGFTQSIFELTASTNEFISIVAIFFYTARKAQNFIWFKI